MTWRRCNPCHPPARAAAALSRGPGSQQCYSASEAFYHAVCGPARGYTPMQQHHEGISHWWVRDPAGRPWDLTASQFRRPPPHGRARGRGFLTKAPSKRARELLRKARLNPNGQRELPFPEPEPPPPPPPGALARWMIEQQDQPCYWDQSHEYRIGVFEYWPQERAWMLDACCELAQEEALEEMRERWTPEDWRIWWLYETGEEVRRVLPDVWWISEASWPIDWGITIHPGCKKSDRDAGRAPAWCLFRGDVREFVERTHRHAGSSMPPGNVWKFSYTIWNGQPRGRVLYGRRDRAGNLVEEPPDSPPPGNVVRNLIAFPQNLIGVAVTANVGPRMLADYYRKKGVKACDVIRLAIDHSLPQELTWKAASAAYKRAAADAKVAGYDKIITFTTAREHGRSLRYARWKPVHVGRYETTGRRGEARAGEMAEPKTRWEKNLTAKGRSV